MAEFYTKLEPRHKEFIQKQKIFFTATAAQGGRINLSPKGMDTFRILDDNRAAYLDLTGSGNETAAHLLACNRITIMFTSFDKKPKILRLFGKGQILLPKDSQWTETLSNFKIYPGIRQIIVINIETVQTSCGYGVPLYRFIGERDTLEKWAEKKGEDGIRNYWKENNQKSIDGLPTPFSK